MLTKNKDKKYSYMIKNIIAKGNFRLIINLNDIRKHSPQLWHNFLVNPIEHIPPFEEALNDFIRQNNLISDITKAIKNEVLYIGISGSFGSRRMDPKNLHSYHITSLVCVEGIVIKVSLVKPKVRFTVQYCETASENKYKWKIQNFRDSTCFNDVPNSLTYMTENEEGKPVTTEYGLSSYEDHQVVSIQDMPERSQTGVIPRSVECILSRDLVDSCKCGDRVQMIGVYRTLAGKISGVTRGEFRTVLIVNHVKQISEKNISMTTDEVKLIKKIAKKKNESYLLPLLIPSMAIMKSKKASY